VVLASVVAFLLARGPSTPKYQISPSASTNPSSASAHPRTLPAVRGRPNLVLILSDDQRWDTLEAMPQVQSKIVDHGITFANSFVVNPECCPSRASILTGQYSHTTGVYKNDPPNGGFKSFRDGDTVATRLHDAGYTTALLGKYLNGYARTRYVPPGWDRWVAFTTSAQGAGDGDYFDYELSIDGTASIHGHAVKDYSTDVLADEAVSFIQAADPNRPLFLYFAPRPPHEPPVPAARNRVAFSGLPPWRPESYNEADVSDKPRYVRAVPLLGPKRRDDLDELRIGQYRTLLALDQAVGRIVGALAGTHRLTNTLLVYASDNGYLWGEHRLLRKLVPYEESIRVPLAIRYDAKIAVTRTDPHLVLNIDWAPTFAQAAGIRLAQPDGRSLLPLLATPSPGELSWREDFLVEHLQSWDKVPTYCAVRAQTWIYVRYATGETEYYDLAADPLELDNLSDDPSRATVVAAADRRLRSLCRPAPPGLSL
jgi:arylsulfatase A-like enzyme